MPKKYGRLRNQLARNARVKGFYKNQLQPLTYNQKANTKTEQSNSKMYLKMRKWKSQKEKQQKQNKIRLSTSVLFAKEVVQQKRSQIAALKDARNAAISVATQIPSGKLQKSKRTKQQQRSRQNVLTAGWQQNLKISLLVRVASIYTIRNVISRTDGNANAIMNLQDSLCNPPKHKILHKAKYYNKAYQIFNNQRARVVERKTISTNYFFITTYLTIEGNFDSLAFCLIITKIFINQLQCVHYPLTTSTAIIIFYLICQPQQNAVIFFGFLIDKKLTFFIIIKVKLVEMCFITRVCPRTKPLIQDDSFLAKPDSFCSSEQVGIPSCPSLQFCTSYNPIPYFMSKEQQIWANLLASVTYNSNLLLKLRQNIDYSAQMIEEANYKVQKEIRKDAEYSNTLAKTWRSKQELIQKLFGKKEYKYKLRLRHKLPTTIYKGRNISLNLQLVDSQDKLVLNSNLVNICVASADLQGNWIGQDQEGEYFIQGKTEVELYHGEASFQKIYPRDVSRQFQHGKIDIVIYPKPSLIQFSSSANTLESTVKCQQIEPVLIKEIMIRAKKKSQ